MRRLTLLEADIQRLGTDCSYIRQQKQGFVISLLQLQLENAQLLRQVSDIHHGGEEESPTKKQFDMDRWDSLAQSVEEQRDLFQGQQAANDKN